MKIKLPKEFIFVRGGSVTSYINQDRILRCENSTLSFEDLMYALAYNLRSNTECPYCGKKIRKKDLTIDHIYPRDYGGISITDNLIPCCSSCNAQKSNLSNIEYQYVLQHAKAKKEIGKLKGEIIKKKEHDRYNKEIFIPNNWVNYVNLSDMKIRQYYENLNLFQDVKTKRLISNIEYIEKYYWFKRPIVLDKNLYIVDGYSWYVAAIECGINRKVPAIIINNMELFGTE